MPELGQPVGLRDTLLNRRSLLSGVAAPAIAKADANTIRIGVISNQSGPGSAFGEATEFAIAQALADSWESGTGKQQTPALGYAHAPMEIAIIALKASGDPKNKEAVRAALMGLDTQTVIGPVNWKDAAVKGIANTPLVGGQWRKTKSGKYKYDLVIVYNGSKLQLAVESDLKLLSQIG